MSGRNRLPAGSLIGAAVAAAVVGLGVRVCGRGPVTWQATNFRGRPVTLAAGPLVAVGAVAGAPAPAAAVAALGAVLAGRYDDVAGARPDQRLDKGFRGHLAALRAGRVSSGTVKIIGIGGSALAAAALRSSPGRRGEIPVDAMLIAGTANLVNLLDLRPGRALKVVALAAGLGGTATGAAGARRGFAALTGAALAALPADLGERTMLGDAGSNGAGALLGLAAVSATSVRSRVALLVAVAALNVASERVSFSAVIDRTAPLRWLDGLGRRDRLGRQDRVGRRQRLAGHG